MHQHRLLTLLSDFGFERCLCGVMGSDRSNQLLFNRGGFDVPPKTSRRRGLSNECYPYFPSGTVHVAVVDPGVGSTRRAVAVEFAAGFLGPDNGLFSGVLSQSPAITAVELTTRLENHIPTVPRSGYLCPSRSNSASGVPISQIGRAIDPATLVQLYLNALKPPPVLAASSV